MGFVILRTPRRLLNLPLLSALLAPGVFSST
jgi:hypothetical protein